MTEQNAPGVGEEGKLQRSASDRAFELFFDAVRKLDGVRERGAKALQDLRGRGDEVTAARIVSALFPKQGAQPSENANAENQASENTGV